MAEQRRTDDRQRDEEADRHRSRMLMKDYYLMRRIPLAPERKAAVHLDHLRWIVGQEKAGRIFVTGPAWAPDGSPREGMTLFRAANQQEAETLAASDPFVLSGAVSFEVERWALGGGRIAISVDLSDMSVHID